MSNVGGSPWSVERVIAILQGRLGFLFRVHQARLPRARAVLSSDQVPGAYKEPFEALVSGSTRFPYAVHVPPYAGLADRPEGKLLFCLGADIHVLEVVGGELTSVRYPVDKISYVEMGLALLYAWFIVRGEDSHGVVTATEFRFNSVTDHLFAPLVESIRRTPGRPEPVDAGAERRKFDYLARPNLKLRNYARRSIAPDERVIQHIYQPEIRAGGAHITILTDRELILIQDGADKRLGKGVPHGGVWDYIPLDKIASISLSDAGENQVTMSVNLPGGEQIERVFSASATPDLEALASRFGPAPQGKPAGSRSRKIN